MTDAVKPDDEPMEISPQVSEGGSEGDEPMDVECINEGETSTEPPCRSAGNTLNSKNLREGNKGKRVLPKRKKDSKLHNNNPEKENEEPPRGSAGLKNVRKRRKTALERSEKDSPERDKDSKPYSLRIHAKGHVGDRGDFKFSVELKRNVKRRS